MPGGTLHKPIWSPYALYGSVDYFYGWPAIEKNDGFTGAQGWLNLVETAMYLVYLGFAYYYGHPEPGASGRGAPSSLLGRRKIVGREAGVAVLIGYSAAVMTVSKTLLYCKLGHSSIATDGVLTSRKGLNEACSGFAHIGHNNWQRLILVWIIPKYVTLHAAA